MQALWQEARAKVQKDRDEQVRQVCRLLLQDVARYELDSLPLANGGRVFWKYHELCQKHGANIMKDVVKKLEELFALEIEEWEHYNNHAWLILTAAPLSPRLPVGTQFVGGLNTSALDMSNCIEPRNVTVPEYSTLIDVKREEMTTD